MLEAFHYHLSHDLQIVLLEAKGIQGQQPQTFPIWRAATEVNHHASLRSHQRLQPRRPDLLRFDGEVISTQSFVILDVSLAPTIHMDSDLISRYFCESFIS